MILVQSDRVVVVTPDGWRKIADAVRPHHFIPHGAIQPYATNYLAFFQGRLVIVLETIGM